MESSLLPLIQLSSHGSKEELYSVSRSGRPQHSRARFDTVSACVMSILVVVKSSFSKS